MRFSQKTSFIGGFGAPLRFFVYLNKVYLSYHVSLFILTGGLILYLAKVARSYILQYHPEKVPQITYLNVLKVIICKLFQLLIYNSLNSFLNNNGSELNCKGLQLKPLLIEMSTMNVTMKL